MADGFDRKKIRDSKPTVVVRTWDDVHPASTIRRLPNRRETPRPKTDSLSDQSQYFFVSRTEPMSTKANRKERPTSAPPGYFELAGINRLGGERRPLSSILKNSGNVLREEGGKCEVRESPVQEEKFPFPLLVACTMHDVFVEEPQGHYDRGRRPSQAAMTQREDVIKFEQGRIKALQEERLHIQKKTFTKWMNSFLQKARMEVDDLFVDLADGKKLLKLLEIISGEKLGKPNNGKMRVHKVENVNKSLAFLQTKKVRLESIGAEDIVDGNPRLILGLIWTIILRFQIQEIEIDVDEDNESSEKKSAKDALLLWCQRKTNGYNGVAIHDFTSSWRNGLGFNALIHAHRPELIDYHTLIPSRHIENLNNAFDVANTELGIPRLLDAEDVDSSRPDEKSILTYVASYYHTFARMKNEMKSGRRIANIVGQMMDADRKKEYYERLTSDLLEWIRRKVIELEDRNFPNSLEGIQKELLRFKQYRTIEKPPKYKERSEIEALFFHINTLLKSLNQPCFQPSEGNLIQELQKAWKGLETAEHRREVALRQELLRQEKLEQLHYKFVRKSVLREGYVKEMIQVLSDPRYGNNMAQVDATVKKHEAISADILARKERFNDLSAMSAELRNENYHGADKVQQREEEILKKWRELLDLLEKHKNSLNTQSSLMATLREIDTLMGTIEDLQGQFESEGVGSHLISVEDLLQKHALQELQVTAVGETLGKLRRHGQQFIAAKHKDAPVLQERLNLLDKAYYNLVQSNEERRSRLEDARNFFQFLQDHEEEESWLIERQRICVAGIVAKDLRAVLSLQQKHKALQDEMKARRAKSDQLCEIGQRLIADKHPKAKDIASRLESLQKEWKQLHELADMRKKQLENAAEAFQFYTDANEAESWLKEKMALVASTDYGADEPSAQALLARHRDLRGEIQAYKGDITGLNSHAQKLIKSGVANLEISSEPEPPQEIQEEWTTETRLVPQEVWEDEVYERVENRVVVENRLCPQVKSLYPFSGQGMEMHKNEVMLLLHKTNQDWWNVRKENGTEGFVPANYVKEIEGKVIPVQIQIPEKVKDTRKVKKTKMVRQTVKVKKPIPPRSPGKLGRQKVVDDNQNIEKRQKNINDTYDDLCKLAEKRHLLLEDSIRLYGFYKECDDFEKWLRDKEKMLKTDDGTDNVETAKRKYEKFLTDLSANAKRIESLDKAVEEFVAQGHSQLDKVKARQRQIHQLWNHLNRLKAEKEKSLEGASSVEVFNRTCDEARDWMSEKLMQLDGAEHGPDLKTVQALQRRHRHLERELAPVEEKVNRVNLLANSVKSSYPHERANVNARQNEIRELWEKVINKAKDKRSRLEDAVGQQVFTNSSKNLLSWADSVKEAISSDEPVRDIATAEALQKKHSELDDDIRAHEDEWNEVVTLGKKLLSRNPQLEDVKEKLAKLDAEHETLRRGWIEKDNWLKQCLDLQVFNREADQIDASTSAHEAFLEFSDLGNSLDDVKAAEKRHLDLESTLAAQDEKIQSFSDFADILISKHHYDSKNIDNRRHQVIKRRQGVKDLAEARRDALFAANNFQNFSAKVDDLRGWVSDKTKIASDESYRDLSNLERKLQKHEAFERELKANEGQLRAINKTGQAFATENNYRSEDVGKMLKDLNTEWENLVKLSRDKGRRLRQAAAQHTYNRTMEDARLKLEEIRQALQSKHVGNDLRNCKDLLKKHQALEMDLTTWEGKISDLAGVAEDMAQEGHFDAENILKASKDCQKKFENLKEPAKKRRAMLEESLRFHKFGFELDAELQWVREHKPLATSDVLGQNLHQAQSLYKKHKKLEAEIEGHQPMIDKTLTNGQQLLEQNHPKTSEIQALCTTLKNEWEDLQNSIKERAKKLELSLKAQEFFFEAGEVESWLTEKNDMLSSTDYGRDRDAATKLLTKHKALELELDSYNGIVTEMGHVADKMVSSKHPDAKAISAKQQLLSQQMKQLQKLASSRQQRLMESMYRHEYFLESAELDQWIREQMQTATSEEYGQDYEHLLQLQSKFDDWKHRMEAGSERFNQCEELAQKLISNDSPYAGDIEKRQDQLRESWRKLLEQMNNREQRLNAAGEIHRFHRDVADALSRIQEKDAALPEDLGRDLNSVIALIKRHEGFENDLVALEAQLQVLIEDAAKLQAQYPGQNSAQIAQQQKVVLDHWSALQQRASDRREILNEACDLHKFLSQARDLMSWSSGLRANMMTEEKVRDAASAQILKAEHEAVKAEIEAREDVFGKVVALSEEMIQNEHYASAEITEKLAALLDERQRLHSAWQHKKVHLDQLIDLHFFLRDAKQIHTTSSAQEAALNSNDFGATVDEVATQVKKHEAFEKLVATQEEKVSALQEHGAKLVQQNHFETPTIKQHLADVVARRMKVAQLCQKRRQSLEDCLLYAQFVRDVAEAESWIGEKQKRLQADVSQGEETASLEEKIKKLQKHQAFQAELTANQPRITNIKSQCDKLLSKKHASSKEIQSQWEKLLTSWKRLLQDADNYGRGLEEAQDILEFNNQVEKIEAWIRDKEMMVQAGEIGKDYEHCYALQRKLDDVDSDMRVDDARMKSIYTLADKLIRQGRSDAQVKNRRDKLSSKWHGLQGALSAYRERLGGALEVHSFNRDLDDTNSRVQEKALALSSNDLGRDLTAVEQLKRRQETLERDMTAIEGKIKEHDGTAQVLIKRFPEMAPSISEKLSALKDQWKRLQDLSSKRRNALQAAYTRHKFRADLKELQNWLEEAISRMKEKELPTTFSEAEAAIHLHEERKAEIDGRLKKVQSLRDFGAKLVSQGEGEELKSSLDDLDGLQKELNEACEIRRKTLQQALQLALFKDQADQAERWLGNKEAFLNNDDLGDSLTSVEALIQKHDAFEKTLAAQSSRIEDLKKFANDIVADNHYDEGGIKSRLKLVISRRDRLNESSEARKKKLLETKKLLQFLRNVYEVQTWLHSKLQIANDENYRDPSNLQSKIQKHAAFEAELQANKDRINGVINEGNALEKENHFASDDIESHVSELESLWNNLLEASKDKREKLNDAYQALLFIRSLEELESWMNEVEGILSSEDHGRDLASVAHLLKKHAALENDVDAHGENVKVLKESANEFDRSDHFMKDEIDERLSTALKRYHSLQEPMQIRKENLEDSLLLHQFIRDADEELEWLEEKEPTATSEDLGSSLTTVQNLQKKHQALEAELVSREPVISALAARAQQMVRSNHFAGAEIEKKMQELRRNFERIKDLSSVRKLRLLDAVESQMFYTEASDAMTWLKEKKPQLTSTYLGKDEDSVTALTKKLAGIKRDLSAFENTVERLKKLSNGLVERGHFDSANIKLKQAELESSYAELLELAKIRDLRLTESKKYFKFLREADEVAEWVNDQTALAASEDYGSDVEHVELLIKKFEAFISSLNAADSRVSKCIENGMKLVNENNPESSKIKEKIKETQQLWDDVKELAHARQEALAGAKQVHVFDRTADETIDWIDEKDAALTLDGFGQDLETIQALVRKHEGFETELAAVKKQVENVKYEANRLANMFPDTREHIEVKQEEVCESWASLLKKTNQRREQLTQAEQLQSYFDQHRDLMAWLNEMIAKITAPDLAQDVAGAEGLLSRHAEYQAEIAARSDEFSKFFSDGDKLVNQGHFLSEEVGEKIRILKDRHKLLLDTWNKRKDIYEQNLDTQVFKRDAEILENWMTAREPILKDGQLGESISHVEELLRKHDDFEKTISAQEEKCNALQRVTLLEKTFQKQKEAEESARQAERERVEKEKIEARKRKEMQRITDERRREDERRRPTEVNGNVVGTNRLQVPESPNLHKTSSFSQLIGDKMRREMKRAESMKVETKKPKRTPSFTTRRRTQSFRKLPPVEIRGSLDRKQELQSGGKKAPVRSWKTFYTVLCGQLLCFFKDKEDFVNSKAASSPVSILNAKCEKAQDYTKRKHVFRLCCTDGSEYLFLADSEEKMSDWVNKICFHAQLPPSMQLLSYDESQKNTDDRMLASAGDISSGSSRTSSPEPISPSKPIQTQTQFLAQHGPPIPPRSAPPPVPPPGIPMRQKSYEGIDVRDGPGRQNGSHEPIRRSLDTSSPELQSSPPPLPVSQPPRGYQYGPLHGSLPPNQSPGVLYNHGGTTEYRNANSWQADVNSFYNQGYGDISPASKPPMRPASMIATSTTDFSRRASESSKCITQQGNLIPQVTLQTSSQNQNQSQNQCNIDDSSISSDQSTLRLTGNESPHSSPKHSPRQTHRKEIQRNERDPSPMQLEKSDPEQQDTVSRSSDSIQPPELNRSVSHDSNNKDRKESRGSDRSKKKSSWYNVFYSTYKSRSEQLKRYFKDLPNDERLIGDYSCALQREILVQGRLYVTQNYLCFYANIFRWEKCICIKWKDVSAVAKGKTAKVIPNAILISTDSEKLFFSTFTARDKAFMMLFRVWQNALMDQTMSTQEVWQWVHTAYGDELGLTSEDEDYNYIPPATNFEDKIYPIERLSADSLSEPQVFGGGGTDKGGSELGSSATDSTNKSQGSVPSHNAFLADSTPSPLQMEVDGMPTDLSDNSSESDVNATGEKIATSCSSPHEGRHVISTVLPIQVDQLFTLMFTNSKFFFEFHTMRQSSDINASSWQQSQDSNEKIRTISMVINLGQALGPKSANVQQTQIMLPCSVSGQLYSIDNEIVNGGIPYADSFYILMHYCLEKVSETETSLNIYGQLKYKKSVWSFVKNLIEKTTWNNMKDHNDSLVKALLAECEETMPKGRKNRRRHRAISNKPVLLPVDHLPSSTRGPNFSKVSRTVESDRRTNILLGVVLAFLVFLVFLNILLYYKLWLLEDFTQVSKFNFWQADVEILKNPPKNHEEWLKILRLQENLHRMEVDKWQKVLKSTVDLLKKAEESFLGLKGSIKSPYEEVIFKKDEQEL